MLAVVVSPMLVSKSFFFPGIKGRGFPEENLQGLRFVFIDIC